jgi:5S rRNA maturation endonuclease (ribonuclease M5)
MESRWKRVNGLSKCPICGKPDWCLLAPDRSAAICPRVSEGSARHIDGSGYLHILRITDEWMKEEFEPRRTRELPEHNEVLAIRARQWITKCEASHITELASRLGVTENSLRLLNVGWFSQNAAWIFPMLRTGSRLLGIRTRPRNGKKFAIKGSKNGLFIPNNLPSGGVVYVCEGESDTAALLSCGLYAVGRPSCNSGDRLVRELLEKYNVVVCADRDGVGRKGAETLAEYLNIHCTGVTMMLPPDKYKDMREWFNGEGKEEVYTTAIRVSENAWGREVHSCGDAGRVNN